MRSRGERRGRLRGGAARVLITWCDRCVRTLDPIAAIERRTELDFELWEFGVAADRRGWSGPRAALQLLLLGLRGVPGDLRWRRAAARGERADEPIRLLAARHRTRMWVPMQQGHVFDQTNGMTEDGYTPPLPAPRPKRHQPPV